MHIRQIERTDLSGMILQHTQTLPEIVYKGCVICFIDFDGDIKGVGTRIIDLSQEEFATLKELIREIDFDEKEEPDYTEIAKLAISKIKSSSEELLGYLEGGDSTLGFGLTTIRKSLIELEMINAKFNRYDY